MYRYYDKNDYKIMEYTFDSITEYIKFLDNAPLSETFSGHTLSSEERDSGFYKTSSLEEAKELAKYGYHENFSSFLDVKNRLEKYIKMGIKKSTCYNYYVGFVPDVKAYLEGNPLSMINKINPPRKQIDIYYNSANLGGVDEKQIFNRGAITLSLVDTLEKMGYAVNLHIFLMSAESRQVHYAVFNLKKTNERVNIQKLFFPMCHPSWLRRLGFKLKEVTPDISSGWTGGYGRTCDEETIRKVIDLKPTDRIICRADEMGISGEDIIEDTDNFLEHIENQYKENGLTNEEEGPILKKKRSESGGYIL